MLLCRLLALTTMLAAVPGLNQQAPNPADAFASLRTEWAKDLHDKKLDQIVMLYAPDAVFLPPNGERIVGRPAIRELTKKAMDTFTSDLTFRSINMEYSGNLAYDSGEFRETLAGLSDGNTTHGQGNYLMVYKQQADGTWLIVQQAWIASPFAH
jgi:uncharacterized protein (TIGR02246 family)